MSLLPKRETQQPPEEPRRVVNSLDMPAEYSFHLPRIQRKPEDLFARQNYILENRTQRPPEPLSHRDGEPTLLLRLEA